MPGFWSRVRHERFPCLEFARSCPAPFSPDAKQPPRQGFSRRIALPPYRSRRRLSARRDEREEDATYRLLQPTFTTRAPVGVSIREHVAFAYTDRQHRVIATSGLNTRALAAPRSLAAARPHVGTHLTVRIELRSHHAQAISFLGWHRAPLRAALPLPRRCRPRARLVMSTSDAPCRARRSPGNPSCHRKPGSLLPPARQCQRLSRPRAPSIDRCPLAPAFARLIG